MNICPLKKYNSLWGDYDNGIHKYKYLKTSIVDLLVGFILASLASLLSSTPLVICIIITFGLLLFLQLIFGVKTDGTVFILSFLNLLLELFVSVLFCIKFDKIVGTFLNIDVDLNMIHAICKFE